jgi:hypothetical protein
VVCPALFFLLLVALLLLGAAAQEASWCEYAELAPSNAPTTGTQWSDRIASVGITTCSLVQVLNLTAVHAEDGSDMISALYIQYLPTLLTYVHAPSHSVKRPSTSSSAIFAVGEYIVGATNYWNPAGRLRGLSVTTVTVRTVLLGLTTATGDSDVVLNLMSRRRCVYSWAPWTGTPCFGSEALGQTRRNHELHFWR